MRKADDEMAVDANHGINEIAAAFDGTWQKQGHLSMNGVVTITFFDTGKVFDYECFSKFCVGCVNKINVADSEKAKEHKITCNANFSGSSGAMEVAGAKNLCARWENSHHVKYTKCLGGGDSKGFEAASASKPYGDLVNMEKLECVGHVQKRLGTRLQTLKTKMKNVKLSDDKKLGGKGRLTDDKIDQLQRYYGLAKRRNLSSVDQMKDAVWATYYHTLSSNEEPNHKLCRQGNDSWCGYIKALALNTSYDHIHTLPKPVMEVIKSVYKDLTKIDLLKRVFAWPNTKPERELQ